MLSLGVPLAAWAIAMAVRGFADRVPFAPGWWWLTFPIGTLALGSRLLGSALRGVLGWDGAESRTRVTRSFRR